MRRRQVGPHRQTRVLGEAECNSCHCSANRRDAALRYVSVTPSGGDRASRRHLYKLSWFSLICVLLEASRCQGGCCAEYNTRYRMSIGSHSDGHKNRIIIELQRHGIQLCR